MTVTAAFAAVIFTATLFIRVPIPNMQGVSPHIGDSVILMAAYIIGGPLGAVAASLGSALMNLYVGAGIYVPATFVIKGLMALAAGLIASRGTLASYVSAAAAGAAIMVAGYYLYETALFGAAYAVTDLTGNLIQGALNICVSAAVWPAAARIKRTVFTGF